MKLGVHVSIAGSIDLSIDRARSLDLNTFQIFTRNPRGWKFSDLKESNIVNFKNKILSENISTVVCHMPYLPNLSSPKEDVYNMSINTLSSELERCNTLGIEYVVTHIGSHLGTGLEKGLDRVVKACNTALSNSSNNTMIVLENTAGTKNNVGSKFDELKYIFDNVNDKSRIGFCFDTCHAFAAGYDLSTSKSVIDTLNKFDQIIGLKYLKVVHLNDSKGELGNGLDRHQHIGRGFIGESGFRELLKNLTIKQLPLILETPIDETFDDEYNINKIYSLAN
ncbi:MAG: deoxyribonuclease IV [Thaumarchaeota archaeon]|jgi:deoxyribonuclease-4|nr:deoxyribonuclease IV [Nitrososphaerales archaeon]NSL74535.1 deoxyribonuclease IV [Nitrososphaerota archaeon]NSL76903.1 deoxyribonuclease IV [Nitrososphaerota archaeon]